MKILQINSFGNLSTGRIAVDIYKTLEEKGHSCRIAFARNSINDEVLHFKIGNKLTVYIDGVLSRISDRAGFYSKNSTLKLIEKIREYDPDVIHLHNLHGYYINIKILFKFLKEIDKPVLWTLHDCWSFTGHCCNFESVNCNKWKEICCNCEQKKRYPASWFKDNSKRNFINKREIFTSLNNVYLITPSEWLHKLVAESYMNKYPIKVIRNGVDLNTFKPTKGNWIKENNLESKKIVLGVAGSWTPTKGLKDILVLSQLLSDDYIVVVVGLTKKQKAGLPKQVYGIERTNNIKELVEIYSSAHCFVNPTYDDNFPNVNLEALACGTPVITYNTGGGPEIINNKCGAIIEKGDILSLKKAIEQQKKISSECISVAQKYERSKCYEEYYRLYEDVTGNI